MPVYTITDTQTGRTLDVRGDSPPTEEEAAAIFAAQPFDVRAQNAVMRKNMAAQPTEAEMQARAASEPWTGQAMLERAGQGLKGEAEGFGGGLLGLASLPVAAYSAIRHPVATAKTAGSAAAMLAVLAKQAADDPQGALSALKDAAIQFGSNPEAIGAAAGGVDAMIATPAILRAVKDTRVGQAIGAGLSNAADRIPGVPAARANFRSTAPVPAEDVVREMAGPAETPRELTKRLQVEHLANLGMTADEAKAAAFPDIVPVSKASPPVAEAVAPVASKAPVTIPIGRGETLAKGAAERTSGQMSETWVRSDIALVARRMKISLTPDQAASAATLVQKGASPIEAVQQVGGPALELSQRLGLPSEAEALANVAERNRTGRWRGSPNGKKILAKQNPPT